MIAKIYSLLNISEWFEHHLSCLTAALYNSAQPRTWGLVDYRFVIYWLYAVHAHSYLFYFVTSISPRLDQTSYYGIGKERTRI